MFYALLCANKRFRTSIDFGPDFWGIEMWPLGYNKSAKHRFKLNRIGEHVANSFTILLILTTQDCIEGQ